VARAAVAPALCTQRVPRSGFRALHCSGAGRLLRAASARIGTPSSGGRRSASGVTVARAAGALALCAQRVPRSRFHALHCSGAGRSLRADAARSRPPNSGGRCSASRMTVARAAVAPALCTPRVPRSGFPALHCSGAGRPLRAASARSGTPNSGGGRSASGVTVVRPARSPFLGTQRERRYGHPARPCTGADGHWRAEATRRRPPISGARRAAADVTVTRPAVAPALCTQRVPRSGFPALHCSGAGRPLRVAAAGGADIGAAAGPPGLGAPPPPAADPQTRGEHRSAARRSAALPASAPALRPQPVPH